ncbi:D-alanyl-D-alanine carboxypeptidase [bacterium A37T11]|nr:D-alanyl-D-alanine carboxypeptidase [bacterium A37T11]
MIKQMKKYILMLPLLLAFHVHAQINKAGLDSLFAFYRQHQLYFSHLEIEKAGKLIYQNSAGYRNVDQHTPIDAKTIFLIGSITKTYTSTMIMQLAQEGKLRLSDKLAQYFPQLPNAQKIDLEMLLRHRSGLFNYTDDKNFLQEVVHPISRAQLLERISAADTLFSPGSKYSYCNSGYVLLGYIIEDLSKDTYAHQLQKRILQKIGVKDTHLGRPADSSRLAYSYDKSGGHWVITKPRWNTDWAFSAGALSATVQDVATFYKALFAGKLVSAASLAHMTSFQDHYGLGMMEVPYPGQIFYGHGGGLENYRTICAYNPKDSILVTQFSNGAFDEDPNNITIQALNAVYGQPVALPDTGSSVKVDLQTLQGYEGTYSSAAFQLKIKVFVQDGSLFGQATGQPAFPLTASSSTLFKYIPANIELEFFKHGGRPAFHYQQGSHRLDFLKE